VSDLIKKISRLIRLPINRRFAFKRLQEFHSKPRTLDETVSWAMKFGGGGYYRIKTLQIPYEITALANAVKAIDPKIILEIGTASGGTLLIWSSIAKESVISCDLQDMTIQGKLFTRLAPPGSKCQIKLISGDSHTQEMRSRVERELNGRKVDFLFIDGEHTETGVTADFNDYRHLVRPGGLIAFHDIVEKQPLEDNQVHKLWKKIKDDYSHEEFIADSGQTGFGIGVIKV
jgi:cephalosporin hydroxylase